MCKHYFWPDCIVIFNATIRRSGPGLQLIDDMETVRRSSSKCGQAVPKRTLDTRQTWETVDELAFQSQIAVFSVSVFASCSPVRFAVMLMHV